MAETKKHCVLSSSYRLGTVLSLLTAACFPPSAALAEITEMVAQLHGTMIKMENFQKLHELKKDLIGIDNLVIPGRVSTGVG